MIRYFTYSASFFLQQALQDPTGLLSKALQKLGLNNASERIKSITTMSNAGRLLEAGQLTGARAALDQRGRISAIAQRGVRSEVNELEQLFAAEFYQSSSATFPNSNPSVLYFLGNSLPFTNSGYSRRSQSILLAAQSAGVNIQAVTRVGYPLSVGNFVGRDIDTIDGVNYRRLIPWWTSKDMPSYIEKSAEMLTQVATNTNASVLHTTTGFVNGLIVSRVAHRLNLPWVYEMRGELEKTWLSRSLVDRIPRTESSEYFTFWREQESKAAGAANRVVTLSEISKRIMVDRGIDPDKIWVVPNSAESELLGLHPSKTGLRTEFGLEDTLWFGAITSVVDYEGLDVAIRALNYLPSNVKFLLVGGGSALDRLKALARKEGLNNRVHFAGKKSQDEALRWYSALDVFVVPRRDTPVCRTVTPIKPLAAMALGVPVVTSDLPALREVTGGVARYAPPESPEALAEAISAVIAGDYDVACAKSWAASRTWEAAGKILFDLYTDRS